MAVIHYRVIPLFALAHFGHHVLTALIVPLLPYIRGELGLSYAQSGMVTAAFSITFGIAQLPAGWLADKVGYRILLVAGIGGVAIAGALVGLANSFWLVVAVFLLMGFFGGGYHPSASALISSSVAPGRRGRALGIHIIGGSTSYFLAPLLAAGLVSFLGWRGTFVGLAAPVFVLGIVMWRLLRRHTGNSRAPGTQSGHSTLTESDNSVAADYQRPVAHIVVFLILTGILGAVIGSTLTFLPLLMVDRLGIENELASALLAIVFSAGFWAAPLGGHLSDRFGRTKMLIFTGFAIVPLVAAFVLVPNTWLMCVVLLLFGAVMFTKMPTSESYIAHSVPPRLRATVLGVYFFSGTEISALLTPAIGKIVDATGFRTAYLSVSVVTLVIATAGAFLLAGIEKRFKSASKTA